MTISALRERLLDLDDVRFTMPEGHDVPLHFHLTEIGRTTKRFIDCGGAMHETHRAALQIWLADDVNHRLAAAKFLRILDLSEPLFEGEDLEIEVEFQTSTVGKYGLAAGENGAFQLTATQTDCLAQTTCGLPFEKVKNPFAELFVVAETCCAPGGGCC